MKKNSFDKNKKAKDKTPAIPYEEKRERHNNARKDSYRKDPEYRERVMRYNRANQRKNGVVLGQKQMNTVSNLGNLAAFGEIRDVKVGRKKEPMLCFTYEELAAVLNIHKMHLYRWCSKGQLPRPKLSAEKEGSDVILDVYNEEQVTAIAMILQAHYDEFCYFRSDHTQTIKRLKQIF